MGALHAPACTHLAYIAIVTSVSSIRKASRITRCAGASLGRPVSLPMVKSPAGTYSSVMPSVAETMLLLVPAVESGAGARVTVLAATEVGVVVAALSGRLFAGGRTAAVSGAVVGMGGFVLLRF